MKIKRFFKTILMIDFVTGLLIAIKESFRQKKTINFHLKKVLLAHEPEVSML